MASRKKKILLATVIVIAVAAVILAIKLQPSINGYQKEFGFSLDGIKVKINAYYHDHAFQDPSEIYVADISGNIEGSVFDTALMADGVSKKIMQHAESLVNDMIGHNKTVIFRLQADGNYKSKELSNSEKRDDLYIIYDTEKSLYYIIWADW